MRILKTEKTAFLALFISVFAAFSVSAKKTKTAIEYFNDGLKFENRDEYFSAAQSYQEAVNINPSYADAYFHLAKVNYETSDFSMADLYIDKALTLAKDNVEMLLLKGYILISRKKLDDASTVFNNILNQYPNNVDARFGLAQIQIFNGRLNGAKEFYTDALKRESRNKKALLSLALLSAETENWEAAASYIQQAMKYHSGEAEVHYLAGFLDAQQENFEAAEKRTRSALQIKPNFIKAYTLLASILYHEKRFGEVIDICDYLISKDRNEITAWYLKGLSQLYTGNEKAAIATWNTGLSIQPTDEILRAALELTVTNGLSLEDKRRSDWAKFHTDKASELGKRYNSVESRYEYQRALRINPDDEKARRAFAEMLGTDGFNEQYIDQLKFIQTKLKKAAENKTYEDIKVDDTVEGYESLLKSSLAKKWDIEPFYLDKTRWKLGLYSVAPKIQMIHPELETITAKMLSDIFTGVSTTAISVSQNNVSGFSDAYTMSKKTNRDYFILISADETDREIYIKAEIYNGRTGTKISEISSFRTGNDRFSSALRSIRREILDLLPVRGKILNRIGNDVIVDLGKTEGMVKGTVLDVIRKGEIQTRDTESGIVYEDSSVLGKISLTEVSEEISLGVLSDTGFYDKVNTDDEVVILAVPDENGEVKLPLISEDTVPAADNNGKKRFGKKSVPEPKHSVPQRTPAILQMIADIN